ncbi:MAG: hypothetical protein ACRD7E_10385 [Bryobacteraceae bacterium]
MRARGGSEDGGVEIVVQLVGVRARIDRLYADHGIRATSDAGRAGLTVMIQIALGVGHRKGCAGLNSGNAREFPPGEDFRRTACIRSERILDFLVIADYETVRAVETGEATAAPKVCGAPVAFV